MDLLRRVSSPSMEGIRTGEENMTHRSNVGKYLCKSDTAALLCGSNGTVKTSLGKPAQPITLLVMQQGGSPLHSTGTAPTTSQTAFIPGPSIPAHHDTITHFCNLHAAHNFEYLTNAGTQVWFLQCTSYPLVLLVLAVITQEPKGAATHRS